jgi:hypothetical protein
LSFLKPSLASDRKLPFSVGDRGQL